MGNFFRKFFKGEDFVAALEQLSKQIHDADHSLRLYRIRWRKIVTRLTYLFIVLELLYGVWWYFLLSSNLLPRDQILYGCVFLIIPLLWYFLTMIFGAYYKYRISSTESLIEDLSEQQETKLEEFKDKGSYKDVDRLLRSLDTPSRPGNTPRHAPASATRRPQGGDKNPTAKVAGTPKETAKTTASTSKDPKAKQTVSAPADPSAPSNRNSQDNEPVIQASIKQPSYSTSKTTPQTPHVTSMPATPLGTRPNVAAPSRVHLHPVPQSPYKHYPTQPIQSTTAEMSERGWMDSFLDFLIGTSASVPKLCMYCGAHNGLVPIEEQHSAQFVCHLCKAFNAGNQSSATASSKERIANALRSKMDSDQRSTSTATSSDAPTYVRKNKRERLPDPEPTTSAPSGHHDEAESSEPASSPTEEGSNDISTGPSAEEGSSS